MYDGYCSNKRHTELRFGPFRGKDVKATQFLRCHFGRGYTNQYEVTMPNIGLCDDCYNKLKEIGALPIDSHCVIVQQPTFPYDWYFTIPSNF